LGVTLQSYKNFEVLALRRWLQYIAAMQESDAALFCSFLLIASTEGANSHTRSGHHHCTHVERRLESR
jgi:hypothetical protein